MKTIILIFALVISISQASASRCQIVPGKTERIKCSYMKKELDGVIGDREVRYQLPEGDAPVGGFPVVIIFQGSFFSVAFERSEGLPFGGYNEIKLIKNLLDNGFAVIAPHTFTGLAWQTNIIGLNYNLSGDKVFINRLIDDIEDGEFGDLNANKLFATGISSGGYMTDRMAKSHSNRSWKALAIASGSYATCGGPLCILPKKVRANHPPTLFMHDEKDIVVPVRTMKKYATLLKKNKIPVKVVTDKKATHQWLDSAPSEVVSWFKKHL